MKKGLKILSAALLAFTIAGCSCSKETSVNLTENSDIITGDKLNGAFTTQDVLEYITTKSTDKYNKVFLTELAKVILKEKSGYKGDELITTYNYKLKKLFEDNYLNNDDYKVDGEFNEELLVAKLRNDMAQIGEPITNGEGPTYELGLKYDYSKYINNVLDYDIYMELLKEDYITNVKKTILNKTESRIVSVYTTDNIEDMEELVADIFSGKYDSWEDLEETKKEEARKEIGRQFCDNLGLPNDYHVDEEGKRIENCTPTKSSYDSALSKFTTCENNRKCSLDDGFKHQIDLIDETVYLKEQIINKDTTDALYANLLSQIRRDDVEDLLISDEKMEELFGANYGEHGKFLLSPTADPNIFNEKNVILSSGPDSTCYLVLVKVVDTETKDIEDLQKVLELLYSKATDASILLHYASMVDLEVIEKTLHEAYKEIL